MPGRLQVMAARPLPQGRGGVCGGRWGATFPLLNTSLRCVDVKKITLGRTRVAVDPGQVDHGELIDSLTVLIGRCPGLLAGCGRGGGVWMGLSPIAGSEQDAAYFLKRMADVGADSQQRWNEQQYEDRRGGKAEHEGRCHRD